MGERREIASLCPPTIDPAHQAEYSNHGVTGRGHGKKSRMDPFRLCLTLGPMAVYLLLIGSINLGRRPFLVYGKRDAAALAMAVSGLVIVGPIELLFPPTSVAWLGPLAWLYLLVIYALSVTVLIVLAGPRLVIYNLTLDQLRPILAELVAKLDPDARWAGDSLSLPNLGVQLHVDNVALLRNISLAPVGMSQSHAGWRRLEQALTESLHTVEVNRNPHGYNMITTGLIMMAALVVFIARDPAGVTRTLFEILNL